MKVLVYGATGTQAKPVVQQLLDKGHEVLAFTRNAAKAADLKSAGSTILQGDLLNYESVLAANEGVEAVALLIPFFMEQPTAAGLNIVKAAKASNIQYIVWNTSGPLLEQKIGNPSYDARIDVQLALEESQIPFTTLQPTVYAENLLGPWTTPFVKTQNKVAYPTPTDYKMGWLPSSDMAKAVVAALENIDLAGSNLTISGLNSLNGTELAAAFTAGLGREIVYYAMPPKEFGQIIDNVMGKGAGDEVSAQYQAIWDGHAKPVFAVEMKEVLKKLNVEFMPLVDWIKNHAFLFDAEEKSK